MFLSDEKLLCFVFVEEEEEEVVATKNGATGGSAMMVLVPFWLGGELLSLG